MMTVIFGLNGSFYAKGNFPKYWENNIYSNYYKILIHFSMDRKRTGCICAACCF